MRNKILDNRIKSILLFLEKLLSLELIQRSIPTPSPRPGGDQYPLPGEDGRGGSACPVGRLHPCSMFIKYHFRNIKLPVICFGACLLMFSALAFPQDDKNPNVELPDFVITGTDVVNIQKAQKIKPELVSTISQSFLKPMFSPEELEIRDLSNPLKNEINLFDTLNYLSGNLKAGVGVYSMPVGELSYSIPFKYGIFEALAFGRNMRAHVENSEQLNIGGAANLLFFVNNEAAFLPGMQFKLHGDYDVADYKFYGSPASADTKRIKNGGNIGLSAVNLLNNVFIYGVNFSDDFISLKEETFSENLLGVSAFTKLELANFSLAATAEFKNQSINNDSITSGKYNFIGVRPTIGLVFSKVLKAYFGFNYQKIEDNSFLAPYASVAFRINQSLSLYGQFTPEAELLTTGDFLRKNPYFNVQKGARIFVENQGKLKAAIKYEYDKYFQIDGGVEYASSDSMPYFSTSTPDGTLSKFDILTAKGKSYTGFIDFLFHPGPFGMFYGDVKFNRTTNTSDNFLTYHPSIIGNFVYGYDFAFGLYTEADFEFNSSSYADIQNTIEIDPYIDLGLKFAYKVANNFHLTFELTNLLNNKNYRWQGYKQTPLDIIAGFNYKW